MLIAPGSMNNSIYIVHISNDDTSIDYNNVLVLKKLPCLYTGISGVYIFFLKIVKWNKYGHQDFIKAKKVKLTLLIYFIIILS